MTRREEIIERIEELEEKMDMFDPEGEYYKDFWWEVQQLKEELRNLLEDED